MYRLLPLLLFACVLPASAQTAPIALPDSVVVTASRLPQSARTVGQAIRVVTAAEIAALPVASVDELLRGLTGAEVLSRGPFGVQSDFTVRGSTFNGVLLLIDGVRFNDPMTGHFLSDFPIPLSEIVRVELLRGPAAAEYGADAVGGVIHVQTQAGLAAPLGQGDGAGGRGSVSGGSYGLAMGDAAAWAAVGDARYTVAAAYSEANGQTIGSLKTLADGITPEPATKRAGFERGAATVALRRSIGQATFSARAAFDARDFDAVRFYTSFASDTAREQTQTLWAQAALEGVSGRTLWRVQAGARQHEDTYRYNPGAQPNEHTTRQATLTAHARRALSAALSLHAGADALARAIDSNNMGEHGDLTGGAWGGATIRMADATLNVRLRADYAESYGLELMPSGDAIWNAAPRLDLRAAASRSVRAPTYVERYFNTVAPRPNQDLGNPNLTAERAWSYEAGADAYAIRTPDARLTVRTTLFRRDVDNLIDFARSQPNDVFLAGNLIGVRTIGAEIEASAFRSVGGVSLSADVGHTALDFSVDGLGEGVQAKYALVNARSLSQLHLHAAWARVGVGVQSVVRTPESDEREAYAVHNVRATFALPLKGADARLTAEVRNLLDTDYADLFAPMPGRWWVLGVRAAF